MDKYTIIKKIGSGSYGVVWEAFNEHANEVVAIKKLNMKLKSVEACLNLKEIKALLKMDHPNIVKLKEAIKEHDTLYLMFECMECSLYDMMSRKTFSEDEIRNLCFQIFQGLAYMHGKGYFHRDLKPENLLVSKDVIKIADLGLAREMYGEAPYTDNVGTLWYRAPEVLLHSRLYDPAVDMWTMGAIMAELFTRNALFPGDSVGNQLYTICSVIGSPPESTWNVGLDHLPRNASYYRLPQLPGVQLSSLLPSASPEAVNLIATLLSWTPCMRPTAMEALEHPFFYSCYRFPPPLRGQPIPLVFKIAANREFEMEMKRLSLKQTTTTSSKVGAFGSERVDSVKDKLCLLPENPFIGSEIVDSTEDMVSMLPEHPLIGSTSSALVSKVEMKEEELKQTSMESCITDSERVDAIDDELIYMLPEDLFY